jgi:4-amino-4-deoxy-L-arabinose transferase-like glycosyltransferase
MLSGRPLDNHECFVSITAREMIASGDWVMPTFNGKPRLQKTPLSYWLVAALAGLTGGVDEFTARFPSAVFAFLSAGAVLYFVNRWLSFRIALIATAVWATSLGYAHWSHSARPEMALAFFVTLCLLSFYSAVTCEDRRTRLVFMLVFWLSFALGNLAKGPAPFVYVLLPAAVYIAINRKWGVIPKLLPVLGVIVFLVIVLPWPIAVAQRVNWDVVLWKREFFDRLSGNYAAGRYPWFFYFLIMFRYIFPWCIFLPIALVSPFYKVWGEKRPVMQFVWLWFVADFVFMTLSGGKRQHYILPVMPAMAILIAILINDMAFVRQAFTPKFAVNTLRGNLLFFLAVALALAAYFVFAKVPLFPSAPAAPFVVSFALILIAMLAAVLLLFVRKRPVGACISLFCGLTVLMAYHYTGLANMLSPDHGTKLFALSVAEMVPPTEKLVSYKAVPAKFIHYTGRTIPEVEAESEVNSFCQRDYWIVAFDKGLDEMQRDGQCELVYMWDDVGQSGKDAVVGGLFHGQRPVVGGAIRKN